MQAIQLGEHAEAYVKQESREQAETGGKYRTRKYEQHGSPGANKIQRANWN